MAEKSKRFEMVASPEWVAMVDDWRRTQPDLPSRAEAIRRLVEQGFGKDSAVDDPAERLAAWLRDKAQPDDFAHIASMGEGEIADLLQHLRAAAIKRLAERQK